MIKKTCEREWPVFAVTFVVATYSRAVCVTFLSAVAKVGPSCQCIAQTGTIPHTVL